MNLQRSYPKGNQPQVLYAGSRGGGRFGRGQEGRGRGRGRFNDFQHHEREENQNHIFSNKTLNSFVLCPFVVTKPTQNLKFPLWS